MRQLYPPRKIRIIQPPVMFHRNWLRTWKEDEDDAKEEQKGDEDISRITRKHEDLVVVEMWTGPAKKKSWQEGRWKFRAREGRDSEREFTLCLFVMFFQTQLDMFLASTYRYFFMHYILT